MPADATLPPDGNDPTPMPDGGDPRRVHDGAGPAHLDGDDETQTQHVASRAHLLPEEQAAGSDDPQEQARVILEESEERTEHPDADASSQSRQSTSRQATD